MSEDIVLIDKLGSGNAVALLKDNILEDFLFDKKNFFPLETIYVCKIDRVVKNVNGYFVSLPFGKKGFLRSSISYKQNDFVKVISNVFGNKEKAQPLSDNIFIKGKYVILTKGYEGIRFSKKINSFKKTLIEKEISKLHKNLRNIGIIIRTASNKVEIDHIIFEYKNNISFIKKILETNFEKMDVIYEGPSAKQIAQREWDISENLVENINNSFDSYGVWEQLSQLNQNKIILQNGSWLSIETTEAFVSIDINSGSLFEKNSAFKSNLIAVDEINKQINLRGLGGKIIIDFIPVNKKQKDDIEKKIKNVFQNDHSLKIHGWTSLGNMELSKKRVKYPLTDFFIDYN